MNRLRVLLVGRHLWPHGSHDSAAYLFQLAVGLYRRGVHVELMTPRYASSWPESMVLREIPVHRPAAAPRSDWSIGRYLRHVGSWLRERGPSYDVLLSDRLREEAIAVVEAGREIGRPTVLRHGGWGIQSDLAWVSQSRSGRRCLQAARSADRVVVASGQTHRGLLAAGIPAERIERIERGFLPGVAPTAATKAAARAALGQANGDLATSADTPVVVCVGRMTPDAGMNRLAAGVRHLVRRFPDARFWFLGDGPHRDSIYEGLRGDGVRASIAMPGSFVDLEDVLMAADVYVQPDHVGLESFMPAAVSAGLPLVMVDDPVTRAAVGVAADSRLDRCIGWVAETSPKALRDAVRRTLESLGERGQLAGELRRSLVRSHPFRDTIEQTVRLLDRLADRSGEVTQAPSSEATP